MRTIKETIRELENNLKRDLTETERRYIHWLYELDHETITTFTNLFSELGHKKA